MRLSDTEWEKTDAVELADLVYLVRGNESVKADISLVRALFQSLAGLELVTANATLTPAHLGRPVLVAADSITLSLDVPVGWWCLIGSPQFSVSLSLPLNAEGPSTVDPMLNLLVRLPDDVSIPEAPVPTFAVLPLATPPTQAAWVNDAPTSSIGDLAAHVNALRDAMVTAGVMEQ